MAVIKVEEFRGDHNKLYLTVPRTLKDYGELYFAAKKRFKVAANTILIIKGWIVDDKLYLQETPRRPRFVSGSANVCPVWVAHAMYFRRVKFAEKTYYYNPKSNKYSN